uniref:Uncharacterized protein n=1 Tax=Panagrolaimus superbus TaxID=310955 RepID=A0A914YRV6_9BILA
MRKIESLAPGTSVSSAAEDFIMTPESSLAMSVMNVSSNYAINKAKKQILNEYGNQINVETSSTCSIKTYTFDQTFIKFLESIDPEEISSLQTVVFSADAGGDEITVTKTGWYPCGVKNPCSEKSFRILCSYEDKEAYEYLKSVFEVALSSLPKWKEGSFFNNLFIRIKAILTGDLKFLNGYCGLQGCQATYFCPTCLIRKNQLIERKRDAPLRTLAQLHEDYQHLQQLLTTATSGRAIAAAHQQCHSIKNEPMTNHFEISHICSGVCHTLAGAVNAFCKWANKLNKEKIGKLYADAGVKLQGHTKQLTGNHGRIMLDKLSNGTIYYDGEGHTLLLLLADIQKYAVAEILSEEQIAELLHCIEAFAYELSKREYDDIAKSSQHIHMIIAHVGPFVIEHHSWGLFSDQPGEAVHKTQNKFYSRIPKRYNNANSINKAVNRNDNFVGNTILQNKFNDKNNKL